ncbi:MAG: hypothetical protein IJR60_08845 [Eubacterium sp.]|nr:hypothetical protein [Eubacterium sp.]
MKKSVAILLVLTLLMTMGFAACKSNNANELVEEGGLEAADNQFGIQDVEVTDKNGEVVTDKKGKPVTTEVQVRYEVDKKGNTIAVVIDSNGEDVTDKKGKVVTVKSDVELTTAGKKKDKTTTKKNGKSDKTEATGTKKADTTKPTKTTTAKAQEDEEPTDKEFSTIPISKDKVPKIDDAINSTKKKAVTFSSQDQQIIKSMLEVPGLYDQDKYENSEKEIPSNIAAHVAIWMVEREGFNTKSYAASTIALYLFYYFGKTAVNFKQNVNEKSGNSNIVYNANSDSFTVSAFESKQQDVTIQKIEFLGNNNYYLVTASVKNAGKYNKVYAIIQKNKLDASLGFSVKALKWTK